MSGKGIDHGTCPRARVARSLWSGAERAFADVLVKALRRKVAVFLKVRLLDVIELVGEADEGGGGGCSSGGTCWGSEHFDYVVCRRGTLKPLLAVELDDPEAGRRSRTGEDVKALAARQAGVEGVRFDAGVRGKLIAEWRLVRAGVLPGEVG